MFVKLITETGVFKVYQIAIGNGFTVFASRLKRLRQPMYGSDLVNLLLQHHRFHRLLRRHRMYYFLNLQRHLHRCFLL
ncbi:hypothetical protein Hanom_Chr04g00322111 [Helianthus anomalus]